jgi:hypothetical protein
MSLIASCCLAGIFPRKQVFRALVFVTLFCFNAAIHSFGDTTHSYEFWLWAAFALATLPAKKARFRFPIAWWGAQTTVLLFYGLSGFWKVTGAIIQLSRGEPWLFGTKGLSYHLASEMLRVGVHPILGNWLLQNQAFSPLLAAGVAVIQLSCLIAIFRVSWRRWIGIALLSFHLGTYFFLSITYPTNVALVGILLAATPRGSFDLPFRKRFCYPTLAWATLGCYLLFAFGTALLTPEGEIFPFFNGHWFVYVPYEKSDYGLYVRSMNGKPLEKPAYVENMFGKFKAWPFSIYGAIQEWGGAMDEHSEEAAKRQQFALQLIFGKRRFEGELRRRHINTLDFVQDRRVISEEIIEAVQSNETETSKTEP